MHYSVRSKVNMSGIGLLEGGGGVNDKLQYALLNKNLSFGDNWGLNYQNKNIDALNLYSGNFRSLFYFSMYGTSSYRTKSWTCQSCREGHGAMARAWRFVIDAYRASSIPACACFSTLIETLLCVGNALLLHFTQT